MQYPFTGDGLRKVKNARIEFSHLGLWFDLMGRGQIRLEDGWNSTKRYHFLELVGQAQFFEEIWHKTFGVLSKGYWGPKSLMGQCFGGKSIFLEECISLILSPLLPCESMVHKFVEKGATYKYDSLSPITKTCHLLEVVSTALATIKLLRSITSSLFFKLWEPDGN